MRGFWSYFGGTIVSPKETFAALLDDPNKYVHALKLLVLLLVPWSAAGFIWFLIKSAPWFPVLINIPVEHYYTWELALGLPMMLLPMIMVAGTIHLLSVAFRGKNTLEDFVPPFLFSIMIPISLFCINDVSYAVLNVTGVVPPPQLREMLTFPRPLFFMLWSVILGGLVWQLFIVPIAIEVTYGLSRGKAALISLISVPWYIGWILLFFR